MYIHRVLLPYFYSVVLQTRGKNMNYLKSAFCFIFLYFHSYVFQIWKVARWAFNNLCSFCYSAMLFWLHFPMNNNHKKHFEFIIWILYRLYDLSWSYRVCVGMCVCLFNSLSHIMKIQIITRQKELVARIITSDNTTNLSHNENLKPEYESKIFYCRRR